MTPQPPPWHALDAGEAAARLRTDAERGLEPADARGRLDRYGPNALEVQRGPGWPALLLGQLRDPLVYVLLAAVALSLVVGETVDALTILAIVGLNTALGFVQEWRAERAMAALQQMLTPHATVLRGGRLRDVPRRELVPGDVVPVEAGDTVPADLRLFGTTELRVDEAPLTGESFPVDKTADPVGFEAPLAERASLAHAGTTVVHGRGRGLVVHTGMATAFGRIADLTQSIPEEPSPLQRKLARLGRQLGGFAVAAAALVGLAGVVSGLSLGDMLLTGISLAVAVVPEGLPAVVTITMALGIQRMVRRHVLVRRLQTAEALGAATIICTDKTGTLTRSEMAVHDVWQAAGAWRFESDDVEAHPQGDHGDLIALLRTAVVCNHAELLPRDGGEAPGDAAIGDPTEAALLRAAAALGVMRDGADVVGEASFSSARKRMTVLERNDGNLVAHVKGAPETLLPRCRTVLEQGRERPLTAAERTRIAAVAHRLASDGQRTLLLARRVVPGAYPGADAGTDPGVAPDPGSGVDAASLEHDLTLLGIVGLRDPPRPEVAAAVATAVRAGIEVVMVTGDAPGTARAVAADVGLPAETVWSGAELDDASDAELRTAIADGTIFARVAPEHKQRLVSLLQADGHIVAMTGDGVNDAPALKQADVGIAMGVRGTDVARGAADVVLTDDHFGSIVAGVEEGRRQFDVIRTFVRYLLSANSGEVLAIAGGIALGWPLVLLPVQILWINLVTDGVSALALGLEPAEPGTMARAPRDPTASLLERRGLVAIALYGLWLAGATLALYRLFLPIDVTLARTVAFTGLVVMEKATVFGFRSLHVPLWRLGPLSNPWLVGAVAATLGLQLAAVYLPFLQEVLHTVPLDARAWLPIVLVALPPLIVPEVVKMLQHRWARG